MKTSTIPFSIGRLFLAMLFFTANSGFTMVVHSCLMEDEVCCPATAHDGPARHSDDRTGPGARIGGHDPGCCHDLVAGGLNHATATLEHQAASPGHTTVGPVVNPVTPGVLAAEDAPLLRVLKQFKFPPSPPGEIYISNSALLI